MSPVRLLLDTDCSVRYVTLIMGRAPASPTSFDTPAENAGYTFPSRGEARRQAMLQAAGELFLEHGFEGTSVSDVVKRSGGSLATLYAWFGSKEGLFEA